MMVKGIGTEHRDGWGRGNDIYYQLGKSDPRSLELIMALLSDKLLLFYARSISIALDSLWHIVALYPFHFTDIGYFPFSTLNSW